MREVKALAEKGFTAEEISEHLNVPVALVSEVLVPTGPQEAIVAEAMLDKGVEEGFNDLRALAFETIEELLLQGKQSVKADMVKFVLKQQLGVYKAPVQNNLHFHLFEKLNERLESGREKALKAIKDATSKTPMIEA